MKLIMLVDGSIGNFEKMMEVSSRKKSFFIDTEHCDEIHEYSYLVKSIHEFTMTDDEIMLAKFSGRDSIVENLGGEFSEMIVSLSYNKNSKYYTECPVDTFLDLVNIFETGD